ncbi:hypothetical protein SAY86_022020 [Trapa natans]|uniref:NAC domain-containing protein n=1 Tax=Trapa natans TaxID=22666 RepID=A0AAN7N034_TRANT|nr:hypothetical protein SAY86_022020 [Trapa natans]
MAVESDSSLAACGSAWPPGFRFHPTDEELILYYLKRKICGKKLRINVIAELDVYKWQPEELPGQSVLKTGDRQWYFFSARDRRYSNGARSNRATGYGYWKVTGKDRIIMSNSRSVGVKKTLVFYQGRAPTGQRTDWVMHEYTLGEEELKRCQNVKEYYALYKVYKKSGAGPKNGEQYGAPFREEDFQDDDCEAVKTIDEQILSRQSHEITTVENVTCGGRLQPAAELDIEEFLNQHMPEPDDPPMDSFVPAAIQPQSVSERETESSLFNLPSMEFPAEPYFSLNSNETRLDLQPSLENDSLAISHSQQQEGSSVLTCAPDNYALQPQFREDFLEIDDLLGYTEPIFGNIEKPDENFRFDEIDALTESDLFHDAAMFLSDVRPLDQENATGPEVDLFNYNLVNGYDYQLQQHPLIAADNNADQFWVHDQRGDGSTVLESAEGAYLHTSGSANESGSNNTSNANQNENRGEVTEQISHFSSALWAFVESIPTNPASASENALVNRAFERMSSFRRVRINSLATNVGSLGDAAVVRRRSKRNKGFILLYVIGVLVALFAMLIGTIKLWG